MYVYWEKNKTKKVFVQFEIMCVCMSACTCEKQISAVDRTLAGHEIHIGFNCHPKTDLSS